MKHIAKKVGANRDTPFGRGVKAALFTTLLAAGTALAPANVMAQTVTVNCPGDSIQAILNLAPASIKSGTMNITGTCTEDVLVTLGNVTFDGGGTAVIEGTVTVDGARRVTFQNLTVTGSGDGILGLSNAAIRVSNSNLTGNTGYGLALSDGAHVEITNSNLNDNGISGAAAGNGSTLEIADSTISGNLSTDEAAVLLNDGSFGEIENSVIQNNAGDGVGSYNHSSVRLIGNTITGNGTLNFIDPENSAEFFEFNHSGVGVYQHSFARFAGGNTVSNNAYFAVAAWGGALVRQGLYQEKRVVGTGDRVGPAAQLDTFIQRAPTGGNDPDGTPDQIDNHFGAIELGRMSTVDLRNASIDGHTSVYSTGYLDHRFGTVTNGTTRCSLGASFGPLHRSMVTYNGGTFDSSPGGDCIDNP